MDLQLVSQFWRVIEWQMRQEATLDEHDELYVVKWSKILHRGSEGVALLPDPPCEIRPSLTHGMGVFATRDITAGSYITMYPADGVSWQPSDHKGSSQHFLANGWKGSSALQRNMYRQELEPIPGTRALAIMGNPAITNDRHFLGHMVNDGACCKRNDAAQIYKTVSAAKANSEMCGDILAVIANRNIKAGEEILTSYGVDYWLSMNRLQEHNL